MISQLLLILFLVTDATVRSAARSHTPIRLTADDIMRDSDQPGSLKNNGQQSSSFVSPVMNPNKQIMKELSLLKGHADEASPLVTMGRRLMKGLQATVISTPVLNVSGN